MVDKSKVEKEVKKLDRQIEALEKKRDKLVDLLWDDRGDHFGNDGIDYQPAQLTAA